jgi:hypothetical protein
MSRYLDQVQCRLFLLKKINGRRRAIRSTTSSRLRALEVRGGTPASDRQLYQTSNMPTARALLITGTVGSGKTAVAVEAARLLEGRGERAAAVDLDWLAWLHVPGFEAYDELIGRQLGAIWPNLLEVGVERLLLARAVLSRSGLAPIRAALPAVELSVVRLVAPPAVIEERLRRRDGGAELAEHLAAFARMAEQVASVPADAVVTNEGRSLMEVAEEVLRVATWT